MEEPLLLNQSISKDGKVSAVNAVLQFAEKDLMMDFNLKSMLARWTILKPNKVPQMGPKIGPEESPKTSCIFEQFWGGAREGQGVLRQAPLGSRRTAGEG